MTKEERTLIIVKPDAMQRSLVGEIVGRFERKGLKIIGLKMMQLSDVLLQEHYVHHVDKPFFTELKRFMQSAPVVVMALSGINAVKACRVIAGPTYGAEAPGGTIRGDLSMSTQANIVHASDSPETAEQEIKRFFKEDELMDYQMSGIEYHYSTDERA